MKPEAAIVVLWIAGFVVVLEPTLQYSVWIEPFAFQSVYSYVVASVL